MRLMKKKRSRYNLLCRLLARYIVVTVALALAVAGGVLMVCRQNRLSPDIVKATNDEAVKERSKNIVSETQGSSMRNGNYDTSSSAGISRSDNILVAEKEPTLTSTKVDLSFLPFAKEIQQKHDKGLTPAGVMVLGMHRSGTSMLTGLLVNSFGYHSGDPLIPATQHNGKGYFELLPVVLQNWKFLKSDPYIQDPFDFSYLQHYNPSAAYEASEKYHESISEMISSIQKSEETKNKKRLALKRMALFDDYGKDSSKTVLELALDELDRSNGVPWIVKDPINCITLRSWLPYLQSAPAVLFTFRHPLDTAKSIWDRDGIELGRGLQIWLVYNKLAILNSADLCRVVASHDGILADPMNEVQRIQQELSNRCRVPIPPRDIATADVESFIDSKLVTHNHLDSNKLEQHNEEVVIEIYGTSKCIIYREKRMRSPVLERLYVTAMKLFCDMQSREAFTPEYLEKLLGLSIQYY